MYGLHLSALELSSGPPGKCWGYQDPKDLPFWPKIFQAFVSLAAKYALQTQIPFKRLVTCTHPPGASLRRTFSLLWTASQQERNSEKGGLGSSFLGHNHYLFSSVLSCLHSTWELVQRRLSLSRSFRATLPPILSWGWISSLTAAGAGSLLSDS